MTKKEEHASAEGSNSHLKIISMLLLIVQNTFSVLFMKFATARPIVQFQNASVVLMAEVVKMMFCLAIILYSEGPSKLVSTLYQNIIDDRTGMLKMGVPSVLYTFQNFMVFVAISNLSPASYTCAFQTKLIFTAINSVLIFGRRYSTQAWISLFMLAGGVAMVQIKSGGESNLDDGSQFLGIAAALSACFSSGIAGVWMEMMLKGKGASLWVKNIQLALWGILAASIAASFDSKTLLIYRDPVKGFFFGFDWAVWVIVVVQAIGGLLVAAVMKFADAVVKGIAICVAVILTTFLSVIFMSAQLSAMGVLGVLTVVMAMYLWNSAPKITT